MKDHGSTTGHIMPSYMLHQAGLDIDRDLQITLLDGARMQALASGEVDAVGTSVRDFAPFLALKVRGLTRNLIIERGLDMVMSAVAIFTTTALVALTAFSRRRLPPYSTTR